MSVLNYTHTQPFYGSVEWKDNVENRCMRVNMNKTKVVISEEWQKVTEKAGRGIGNNSIQCTSCQKWVHRKCSATHHLLLH